MKVGDMIIQEELQVLDVISVDHFIVFIWLHLGDKWPSCWQQGSLVLSTIWIVSGHAAFHTTVLTISARLKEKGQTGKGGVKWDGGKKNDKNLEGQKRYKFWNHIVKGLNFKHQMTMYAAGSTYILSRGGSRVQAAFSQWCTPTLTLILDWKQGGATVHLMFCCNKSETKYMQ